MEALKDYIFYTILKDDELFKQVSYGIKRGNSLKHEDYFANFIDIDPLAWEGIQLLPDWHSSCENIAGVGSVMIVNTAIEVENIEDRMYGIYLPTYPTLFQLETLKDKMSEFENMVIDVSVYGVDHDNFIALKRKENFDSWEFLKVYINYHMATFEEEVKIPKQMIYA